MKDANDPPPPALMIRRLEPIPAVADTSWRRDLEIPEIVFFGAPGSVEARVRGTVRYIVSELAARVARELREPQPGRWPEMRKGMLLDIQRHMDELTMPVIPESLKGMPLSDMGFPAEILGYGDLRTVELQLNNVSADMRLLALGLDRLERDDADALAAWLRATADDLDPWR